MRTWVIVTVLAVGCGSDISEKNGDGSNNDSVNVSSNADPNARLNGQTNSSANAAFNIDSNIEPNIAVNNSGGMPPDGALRVFVTRTKYTGDLGGLAGADSLCTAAAASASLGGEWVAWLSDEFTDAIDRVSGEGPWYRMDGEIVFNNAAHLATTPLNPILLDEFGTSQTCGVVPFGSSVWTGTGNGGRAKDVAFFAHCDDWNTSASNTFDASNNLRENNAVGGDCDSTAEWTDHGASNTTFTYGNCAWDRSLYCFEIE